MMLAGYQSRCLFEWPNHCHLLSRYMPVLNVMGFHATTAHKFCYQKYFQAAKFVF